MACVLVDSNVLLDVMTDDPQWAAWLAEQLSRLATTAVLAINPIVFAEVSIGFERIEEVEATIRNAGIGCWPIPREAAFLAGKCFVAYRARGGAKHSPLPDFFIGAHATVLGVPLLTRDLRRFQTYFPALELIAP